MQICSAMMKEGHGVIGTMNSRIAQWMNERGFGSIESFKGKLSRDAEGTSDIWERSQYIKAICGIS